MYQMANVKWDTTSFLRGVENLIRKVEAGSKEAKNIVADEILRLSQFEVPHDKGLLQNSGKVEPEGEDYIVGYNKVYAARLHEHPKYHFQKGRKGKYMEDPIKMNEKLFLQKYGVGVQIHLK